MKDLNSIYDSPSMDVIELYTEGILCSSDSENEQFDHPDNVTGWY